MANIWLSEITKEEQDFLIDLYDRQPLELDHLPHTLPEEDITRDFIERCQRFKNYMHREELRRVHETLIALRKKGVLPRKRDGQTLNKPTSG